MTAGQIARMDDAEVLDLVDARPAPDAMRRLNADVAGAPTLIAEVMAVGEAEDAEEAERWDGLS